MNDSNKILIAALGGVVLGAAAGLLLAPKSGKETRNDIMNKIKDIKKQLAKNGGNVAKEKIEELEASLSSLVKQLADKV